jgi:Domain of unknown function (DUF4787)
VGRGWGIGWVGGDGGKGVQRALTIRQRKQVCRQNACAHLPMYEDDNCVNQCVSAECYEKVYGAEPVRGEEVAGRKGLGGGWEGSAGICVQLEPGEIDQSRSQLFSTCVLQEMTRSDVARMTEAAFAEEERGDGVV